MAEREVRSEEVPATADELGRELESLRASEDRLKVERDHLVESQNVLEIARDQYFELFDLSPLPLLTLDTAGSILDVNQATCQLLGKSPRDLRGTAFRRLVHPGDRAALRTQLLTCAADRSTAFELRLVQEERGGQKEQDEQEVLPVQMTVRSSVRSPLPATRPARVTIIHASLTDIREHVRAREDRNSLIEAEQKARQAVDSKDQFIAMLSHELRTPLTPALAAASAFKKDPSLSPDMRAVLTTIERNISAEARLVDDLLDATGLARGKTVVVREPTDLHAILRECVQQAMADTRGKSQSVVTELLAHSSVVQGDALRLRQIFSNLLRNAIKFTPTGGRIHLRSWNREDVVVVEVEDTGVGFEPGAAARLFAPFEQVRDAGASLVGGLGLGLAIAKGLVELHGGRIDATSRGRGRGARFAVELPTVSEPPQPLEKETLPRPGRPRPLRIMLVEDDVDSAEMMLMLLKGEGHDVILATSVRGALEVNLSGVDIIVSDLGLPDGSGTELLGRLHDAAPCPAIALSGFGMDSDIQATKRAGFDLHLTKPVDFGDLLGAIYMLAR